jgi:hypothetical protein
VVYRAAQRTPVEHAWLGLSIALNILGIAGIAEDTLKWKSFLANLLYYYRRYVTEVIYNFFSLIWPDFLWFPLPYAVSDLLVLMAGFFAAANFYTIQTEGMSVIERVWKAHCNKGGFIARGACLIVSIGGLYILGPLIYLRALITGPKRIHRVLGFVFSPAQIMRYYLILLIGAGILIFILLQFGL